MTNEKKEHPVFETERLIIRPTIETDAAFILALMTSPKWLKYIGDRGVYTLEEAENYIKQRMLPQLDRLGFSNFTMIRKSDGAKVGVCGLYDRPNLEGIDLGYSLLEAYEGQGYASEGAQCLCDAAIKIFNIKDLRAITLPYHEASKKILFKLGFSVVGPIHLSDDAEELLLFEYKQA